MKKFFFPVFLASLVFFTSTVYSRRLESPIRVYSPRLETPVKIARPDFSGTWKLNPAKSGLPSGISDHLFAAHRRAKAACHNCSDSFDRG